MQKDTWIIIGVLVTLVGLQATFMVTSLTSIESRLTAMDNNFSARLATMDGRLHEMNTRLSRIEGHLRLPADIEPIRFETMDEVIFFKEDGRQVLERRNAEVFSRRHPEPTRAERAAACRAGGTHLARPIRMTNM